MHAYPSRSATHLQHCRPCVLVFQGTRGHKSDQGHCNVDCIVSFSHWMKYPDLLDVKFPLFPLHCSVAMIVSLFLICRAIKSKKMTRQLYLFTALWVCVFYWHKVLNASNTGTELPCVFIQLFPSLRHRADVNNRTAGCCPVGPYVFIGLDQNYVSLFWKSNVFSVLFKQGLVSECAVWTAELGPVLTKTSGNCQPFVLCSFLKDAKRCLSRMPVPCACHV